MKVGIVGMPNAGKSSLFNALTRAGAEAANYPFTTIEPNVAVVPVVDERLDRVAETIGSSNVVYDTIDFHDIAGLVRGASEGEGLGNKFLANIREVDAIVHVAQALVCLVLAAGLGLALVLSPEGTWKLSAIMVYGVLGLIGFLASEIAAEIPALLR